MKQGTKLLIDDLTQPGRDSLAVWHKAFLHSSDGSPWCVVAPHKCPLALETRWRETRKKVISRFRTTSCALRLPLDNTKAGRWLRTHVDGSTFLTEKKCCINCIGFLNPKSLRASKCFNISYDFIWVHMKFDFGLENWGILRRLPQFRSASLTNQGRSMTWQQELWREETGEMMTCNVCNVDDINDEYFSVKRMQCVGLRLLAWSSDGAVPLHSPFSIMYLWRSLKTRSTTTMSQHYHKPLASWDLRSTCPASFPELSLKPAEAKRQSPIEKIDHHFDCK